MADDELEEVLAAACQYIVVRGHPDLPAEFLGDTEGKWYKRPRPRYVNPDAEDPPGLTVGRAVAVATERVETRADGEWAQVYEVRP